MKIPTQVPEKGFYYHYKHDSKEGVRHYAYEVMGVGCHSEDDCAPEDANMVVYRPLYEDARVYKAGKFFDLRPLEMFMEDVVKDDKTIQRFRKITDPNVIADLEKVRDEMYS